MQTTANPATAIPRRLLERYLRDASEAVAKRNQELGRRIRQARDLRGLKQKELARAVNVEPVTVSRWERGENTPDLGKLEVVARTLDQPLSYFVEQPIPSPAVAPTADARLEELLTDVSALIETSAQAMPLLRSLDQRLARLEAALLPAAEVQQIEHTRTRAG